MKISAKSMHCPASVDGSLTQSFGGVSTYRQMHPSRAAISTTAFQNGQTGNGDMMLAAYMQELFNASGQGIAKQDAGLLVARPAICLVAVRSVSR